MHLTVFVYIFILIVPCFCSWGPAKYAPHLTKPIAFHQIWSVYIRFVHPSVCFFCDRIVQLLAKCGLLPVGHPTKKHPDYSAKPPLPAPLPWRSDSITRRFMTAFLIFIGERRHFHRQCTIFNQCLFLFYVPRLTHLNWLQSRWSNMVN